MLVPWMIWCLVNSLGPQFQLQPNTRSDRVSRYWPIMARLRVTLSNMVLWMMKDHQKGTPKMTRETLRICKYFLGLFGWMSHHSPYSPRSILRRKSPGPFFPRVWSWQDMIRIRLRCHVWPFWCAIFLLWTKRIRSRHRYSLEVKQFVHPWKVIQGLRKRSQIVFHSQPRFFQWCFVVSF